MTEYYLSCGKFGKFTATDPIERILKKVIRSLNNNYSEYL
jgi:hypothetical protein